MRPRLRALLTVALVAAVAGVGAPAFSTAAFTARTTNTASVSAAADWTPPTVSLVNPGSPVRGSIVVSATASDAESGIQNVVVQVLPPGGSWTTLCTSTAAPYGCPWNTAGGADGTYGLRATATDKAGYASTTSAVQTTVANNVTVVLADPGDVVRGSVPLSTSVYGGGTATYTVRVEYSVADSGSWKSICTGVASPYGCSWSTASLASGSYDLRSIATSGSTSVTSAAIAGVLVDNTAPTVTTINPGSPLRGTVTLAATATDADSGIDQVRIQIAPSGSTSWTDVCTLSTSPYSCRYDTSKVVDGTYSFRSVATDAAGNTTTSATVSTRVVDNTVSAVAMEDPGDYLSGTTALTATASSSAGVRSVTIQRAPSGTTSWTDVCTDTTSPYGCSWSTTGVQDGLYDLRALLVDGTGATTVSTTVSARRVDNTPLRAYDVQTSNGGGTAGRIEPGDSLTFTYNDLADLSTISSGWGGEPRNVTLRVRDGNLLGQGSSGDTVDVQGIGSTVNLGSVNLRQDYIKTNKSTTFSAIMTASTATVAGVSVTRITVDLGSNSSSGLLRTTSSAAAMVWTPSSAVRDLLGRASSTTPVTELGTSDRDF
ncbi:MAG: Ig-like domain-containing protein [Terracoccus sp.]